MQIINGIISILDFFSTDVQKLLCIQITMIFVFFKERPNKNKSKKTEVGKYNG